MKQSYYLLMALLFHSGLKAQLPDDRESHHKVVFQNKSIRLLEGRISANDTTAAHVHAANSVVIFLSHSTFGIRIVGDKPVVTTVNPGDMKYVNYGDKPVNHIVWNQTAPLFHFFVVELTKHPSGEDTCAILSQPGVSFQWKQPAVNAYTIAISNDRPEQLPPSRCARLLVDITGVLTASGRQLQPNQFAFFPASSPINLRGNARCILLEIN